MGIWGWLGVFVAGFCSGFINTIAGSGSLLTVPLLVFLGIPVGVANGTTRVGILLQNIVGLSHFHANKLVDWKRGRILVIPGAIGALIGANWAVVIPERELKLLFAAVMFALLLVGFIRPERFLRARSPDARVAWWEFGLYFALGLYGGLIQAGIGVFLMAALTLVSGYDMVRGNAIKLLFVLAFTPFALFVFAWHGQVLWGLGLWMGLGSMIGAWVGAREAVKRGAPFLRVAFMAVILVSALKLAVDAL